MASGLVLVQLSRFETRADNFGDARSLQAGDLIAADPFSFFQSEPRRFDRTGENGAVAVGDRNGSEFHAAFSDVARKDLWRKAATISPRIAMAISAGLTAPMSSPIGA